MQRQHIIAFMLLSVSAVFAQRTGRNVSSQSKSLVPFVGCKADGQAGPLDEPTGEARALPIPTAIAQQLAYYKAEQGPGVLAPRGWSCFCTYGSSGGNLFVTPQPINTALLFSDKWQGFTGPVVQLSASDGDTSGRYTVASIIARVFPAHRAFVRKVIREGIEPSSDFPSGPYPKDKLFYRNSEIVEFETPANSQGLGTRSHLLANGESLRGAEILVGNPPSLISLVIRLPAENSELRSVIIRQTERDAAGSNR